MRRMNKDTQLIYEAYNNMPPQCPSHLLEEGLSHQLHAWVFGKALPWLQANKGKVAAAGGVAAALAAFMGMDPDTAQQVVDGMDPETLQGLEGGVNYDNLPSPVGDRADFTDSKIFIDWPNKQVLVDGQPATHDQIVDHIEGLEKIKTYYLQWIDNAGPEVSDNRIKGKWNQVEDIKKNIKDLEAIIGITDAPHQNPPGAADPDAGGSLMGQRVPNVTSPKPQVNPSDF